MQPPRTRALPRTRPSVDVRSSRARPSQVVTGSLPSARRIGLTQRWPSRPSHAANRSLRATAATRNTVTTATTSAIPPMSHVCSLPASAGRPSATQRTKNSPGAANTNASVITLTLTVAPANRSVLTPQLRRTTYWVAVPDGPGTTLLTADDDSRAISERTNESPGMTGGYAAASSTRMTRAATSSTVKVRADIELMASHTPLRLPRAGTMTRNSRTSSPPESAALSTFISTDVGPGRSPRASPDSAADA